MKEPTVYYDTGDGLVDYDPGDGIYEEYVLRDDYENLRSEYGDFEECASRTIRAFTRKLARANLELEVMAELLLECKPFVTNGMKDEIDEVVAP